MSADYAIPGLMPLAAVKVESEESPPFVLEPHHISNSLWQGIVSVGPYVINDAPPPFPADLVTLTFVNGSWPCLVLQLSSAVETEIVKRDADNWWFSVPEQPLLLPVGLWEWKMAVVDTTGNRLEIFHGILPVIP